MPIQRSTDPDTFRAFEQAGWDRLITGYERAFGPLTGQTAEPLLDAAAITGGSRVLDVCTGHGVLAAAAVKRGAIVCGIDIGEAVVAAARRNAPAAEFRQADAEALPFADNDFDAVVCGYGVIHVPDPERALREMLRVVRPGGRVSVSVWERALPTNGFGLLFGSLRTHGRLDIPLPHGPDMFQFSDPESLRSALEAAGLADIGVVRVEQTWRLKQPDDFIASFIEGVVRGGALLTAQTPDALAAIKSAAAGAMEARFRDGDGYSVPMAAFVGAGAKP